MVICCLLFVICFTMPLEQIVAGCITLHEMNQPMEVSLSEIHRSLLSFLQNRPDLVVFGAYAVNAYLKPEDVRMTADIDIQALQGKALASEVRQYLNQEFYIATRIREIGKNKAWRIYQIIKSGNRHLVDIRQVENLPNFEIVNNIQILSPLELIQAKIISAYARRQQPKGFSDLRDLYSLMLTFPQLVGQIQLDSGDEGLLQFWRSLQSQKIDLPEEDEDLLY